MRTPVTLTLPGALVALGFAACSASDSVSNVDSAAGGEPLTFRFDDAAGALPAGWRVGTSNADGADDARWEIRPDPTAPSPPNALALVDASGHIAQQFNVCWRAGVTLADVDVAVAVHAAGGVEDQGGGPAWRIVGENDYYSARWNPLEDNFRVYSVKGGERLQLASARVRVDDVDAWHTIRVRHVGSAITCWFDGEELLNAEDTKLPKPGAVGVWTKADATTHFDDLVAEPAR